MYVYIGMYVPPVLVGIFVGKLSYKIFEKKTLVLYPDGRVNFLHKKLHNSDQ